MDGSETTTVLVRSPEIERLADVLRQHGAKATPEETGALLVTEADQAKVGELAFEAGVVLHELTTKVATLEEAFLEATEGSEEFIAQLGGTAALEGLEGVQR